MSAPLIVAALWVVAATIVALLPMRRQFAPGFVLLIAAPVLIVCIGFTYGWFWSLIGVAAFASMFRKPLWYLARRVMRRL